MKTLKISIILFILLAVNTTMAMKNKINTDEYNQGGEGGGGAGQSIPLKLENTTTKEYIVSQITDSKGRVDAGKLADFLVSLKQ